MKKETKPAAKPATKTTKAAPAAPAKAKPKTKPKAITNTRVVVTDTANALKMFRTFAQAKAVTGHTVGKSKRSYYTIAQFVEWYNKTNNANLDRGWFGRTLNAAKTASKTLTIETLRINGRSTKVYAI